MIENVYEREARQALEEKQKIEKSNQSNWFNRLDTKFQILLIGLVFIGLFYVYTKTTALESFKDLPPGAIIVGLVAIIALFSLLSKQNIAAQKVEKTHIELMTLLKDQLNKLQNMPLCSNIPQIPQGKLKILPSNRRSTVEFDPFKKTTSIELIDEESVPRYFMVEQDVFNGNILAIISTKIPYEATEKQDFRWILPTQVRQEKGFETYMGGRK
jgi:hypothetical protein